MSTSTGIQELRVVTASQREGRDGRQPLREVLADLRRTARDGDLVLLQGISPRVRPLVDKAFPAPDWGLYFGCRDNSAPIAYRKELLAKVRGDVTLLHPHPPVEHGRRYGARLRLVVRPLGTEVNVTNVQLDVGTDDDRERSADGGLSRHLDVVEDLVAEGLPLVGGGDYGVALSDDRPLGDRVRGHEVVYAVDSAAADHLWFVDGDEHGWRVVSTRHSGRDDSDGDPLPEHGARQAVVVLGVGRDRLSSCEATCEWCERGRGRRPADGRGDGDGDDGRGGHEDKGGGHTRRGQDEHRHGDDRDDGGRGPHGERADHGGQGGRGGHGGRDGGWPDKFEHTTFGEGTPKTVDWKTRAALEDAERRLGYRLTIVQGSYNPGGVGASGGTHDLGGVVDLLPGDWQHKVRVLRALGFAAWHRPAITGLWGEHIHAVMVEHGNLSTSAKAQVAAYRAGRDGLVGNAVDNFWRPDPIPVFAYPPSGRDRDGGAAHDRGPDEQGRKDDEKKAGRRRDQDHVPPSIPKYPPHRTLDGVDTSHFQSGRIDLKRAQAAGLRWWYVKATEGSGLEDPLYAQRVREARRASLPVGAYHFARPDHGDAAEEARFFLARTDIRVGDMLPMLDLESAEGLSPGQLTTWTGTWVETVTRALARRGMRARPIIYTPFNLGKGFGCYLWVARYSDDFRAPVIPKPWARAVIWQHSDGRYGPVKEVPGFGPVDVNALHPDVPLAALRVRSTADAPERTRPRAHDRGRDDQAGRRHDRADDDTELGTHQRERR